MGAMILRGGKPRRRFTGKSAAATSPSMTSRIPIGDLQLKPAGKIESGTARLDLWNAEARGRLKTDKGEIQFRSFTHTDLMVQIIEITTTGEEQVIWGWTPGLAANHRKIYRKEPLLPEDQNAPPVRSKQDDIEISFQPLEPAGGHATAWKVVKLDKNRSVVYVSVGYAKEEVAAKAEAVAAVRKAAETGLESLVQYASRVVASLLAGELSFDPRYAAGKFLLDSNLQNGQRHAARPAGVGSARARGSTARPGSKSGGT